MTDPTAAGKNQGVRIRSSGEDRSHSKEQLDDWRDEALADTFPASDPIASPPGFVPVVEEPHSRASRARPPRSRSKPGP